MAVELMSVDTPLQQRPPKAEDSMPFFGSAFFQAVEGYSSHVAIGYLRLLWHYYTHTKCQGLPNDDAYLRNVSRCPEAEWSRVKGIIFDNQYFFCQNGTGLWHQKTAKEIHDREKSIYEKRVAWAQHAREQKTQVSGNITINKDVISPIERVQCNKEYERVLEKMEAIRGTYSGHQNWRAEDRRKYAELQARKKELKQLLGVKE